MTAGVFQKLAWAATALAFVVVVLGAWVRVSDAGLGCPDWPGCYGQLTWPQRPAEIAHANAAFPANPYDAAKAWREMVHRYAAGTLGVLVLVLAVIAWRRRREPGQPVGAPLALLALIVFQALLGMWTVLWKLHPVIVMGHLLGGFATVSLLLWTALAARRRPYRNPVRLARGWVVAALVVLGVQVVLGGWTSANYAGLACPDFPTCQGQWWPRADFSAGFDFIHPVGVDYEFGVLDLAARTAIHMTHRLGAIVTVLALLALAAALAWRRRPGWAALVAGLVLLQAGLGIANVLLRLPLPVAVGHNAVAAALVLTLVALLHRSSRGGMVAGHG